MYTMTPENADRGRLSMEKGSPIRARQPSRANDRQKNASIITKYYCKHIDCNGSGKRQRTENPNIQGMYEKLLDYTNPPGT